MVNANPNVRYEQEEIARLRDLLPASLRPLISIAPRSTAMATGLIGLRRRTPWRPEGIIEIDFSRWRSVPQPERDLLFLRQVGWFDTRNWLQPGLFQVIAVVGGISTVAELALQNPFSALLAGGVTGLAINQIRQSLSSETAELEADEFALRRAQFRGYDRRTAARHLISGLESVLRIDATDIKTVMRLQRLKAIAQEPAQTGGSPQGQRSSSGDSW